MPKHLLSVSLWWVEKRPACYPLSWSSPSAKEKIPQVTTPNPLQLLKAGLETAGIVCKYLLNSWHPCAFTTWFKLITMYLYLPVKWDQEILCWDFSLPLDVRFDQVTDGSHCNSWIKKTGNSLERKQIRCSVWFNIFNKIHALDGEGGKLNISKYH